MNFLRKKLFIILYVLTIKRALADSHTFFADLLCLCVGCRVNAVVFVVHLGPTFEFQMQEEHLRNFEW